MGARVTVKVNGPKSKAVHWLGYAEIRSEMVGDHGNDTDLDSPDPDVLCMRCKLNYTTGPGKGEPRNCTASYRHVDLKGNAI